MAKGSVRKKGKKWYARFYIEDESGRKVQKEFVGTEPFAIDKFLLSIRGKPVTRTADDPGPTAA